MGIVELLATGRYFTDKDILHSYGPFYDGLFAPFKDRPVRLLEVGVHRGASVRLWRDYFPRGEVVGVDRDLSLVERGVAGERVKLIEMDAYAAGAAGGLGEFDVIIDDGSHAIDAQIAVIEMYLPLLRPRGVMVIEDVAEPDVGASHLRAAVPAGFESWERDLRRLKGRHDDFLFVIRRPLFA